MASTLKQPPHESEPVESRQERFNAKEYLERTLPRKSGDLLKVFPMQVRDSFRVNWYSSRATDATIPGLGIVHIRESKFLFCRLNAEGMPEITYPAKQ